MPTSYLVQYPKGAYACVRIAAKPSLSERRGARRPSNSDATNAGVYGRAGRERPSSVPAAVRMHGTRPLSSADAMCAGTNGSLVKKADRPAVPRSGPSQEEGRQEEDVRCDREVGHGQVFCRKRMYGYRHRTRSPRVQGHDDSQDEAWLGFHAGTDL